MPCQQPYFEMPGSNVSFGQTCPNCGAPLGTPFGWGFDPGMGDPFGVMFGPGMGDPYGGMFGPSMGEPFGGMTCPGGSQCPFGGGQCPFGGSPWWR